MPTWCARSIWHGNFGDPEAKSSSLHKDLAVDLHPIASQMQSLEGPLRHGSHTALGVSNTDPMENPQEEIKERSTDHPVKPRHCARADTPRESTALDELCSSQKATGKRRNPIKIVRPVAIRHQDPIPTCRSNALSDRPSVAAMPDREHYSTRL